MQLSSLDMLPEEIPMPCQVSLAGFVVTAFMRSSDQTDPMNWVATNREACHLELDKWLE